MDGIIKLTLKAGFLPQTFFDRVRVLSRGGARRLDGRSFKEQVEIAIGDVQNFSESHQFMIVSHIDISLDGQAAGKQQ